MSTITEVAKKAGVSNATVSRVLSGAAKVREETRLKVLEAIVALSYVPNQAARALASKKSYTIGLAASNIDSVYYGPAARGVESVLRKADRHVIIASGNDSLEGEREAVSFLKKRQVDALVLLTHYMPEDELSKISEDYPVFVLNQPFPGGEEKNISFDNFFGGRIAAQYLVDQGHTRIATVKGPQFKYDAVQRQLGCTQVLNESGLRVAFDVEGDFTIESGVGHMEEILALKSPPSAVFFANDLMAMGALHVCAKNNIKVPEEMAIIGFDDIYCAQYCPPGLTTIKLPLFDMAESTAHLLLNRIYGCTYPVKKSFQPELVIRGSA